MFEFLEVFTSYYNRLYTSETGVKSQRWLYDEILDVSIVLIFSVSHTPGSHWESPPGADLCASYLVTLTLTYQQIVRKAPSTCRLSIERFPHSFPQDSIIARFSPSGTRDLSQPVTIIGAHPDSVNLYFPLLNAPGADDNGSGTATILEAFRTLVSVGFEPVHGPVEFHWWAGEEAGLLGSQVRPSSAQDQ